LTYASPRAEHRRPCPRTSPPSPRPTSSDSSPAITTSRIACSAWPLENHSRGRSTQWHFLPDGQWYGIPVGCLVVEGFDNLLVAGRNLSAEHAAQASARVAGPCLAMGEAAGTLAAMSLAHAGRTRAVDAGALQDRLRAAGAILTPDFG
jgi:hypothetical protein